MGIWYDYQRADVSDRELVTVMARLVIILIVLDQIRQEHDQDEQPDT